MLDDHRTKEIRYYRIYFNCSVLQCNRGRCRRPEKSNTTIYGKSADKNVSFRTKPWKTSYTIVKLRWLKTWAIYHRRRGDSPPRILASYPIFFWVEFSLLFSVKRRYEASFSPVSPIHFGVFRGRTDDSSSSRRNLTPFQPVGKINRKSSYLRHIIYRDLDQLIDPKLRLCDIVLKLYIKHTVVQ